MDIHEFVALPHRFRWGGIGGDDCMTFCASWVRESIGVDPAQDLRGTYSSKEGAHAVMQAFGGALPFMEHHLASVGAKRVQQPQDGDIALIKVMSGETYAEQAEIEVSAIRFGPLWVVNHPAGIRAAPAEFIAAWRLPA